MDRRDWWKSHVFVWTNERMNELMRSIITLHWPRMLRFIQAGEQHLSKASINLYTYAIWIIMWLLKQHTHFGWTNICGLKNVYESSKNLKIRWSTRFNWPTVCKKKRWNILVVQNSSIYFFSFILLSSKSFNKFEICSEYFFLVLFEKLMHISNMLCVLFTQCNKLNRQTYTHRQTLTNRIMKRLQSMWNEYSWLNYVSPFRVIIWSRSDSSF